MQKYGSTLYLNYVNWQIWGAQSKESKWWKGNEVHKIILTVMT